MIRRIGIRRTLLALLLIVVMLVRFTPHAGEVYARCVYPYVSAVISAIASVVSFSLDEWIVITAVALMIIFPFYGHKHGRKKKSIIYVEIEIALWMVVWFYAGWGMNYFRDNFFKRAEVQQQKVDKQKFLLFLNSYTDSLNAYYTPIKSIDKDSIRTKIKEVYSTIPKKYGLCQPKDYQQPKSVSFNFLYSSVGVLGYMGPFADESHLNNQLFPVQYSFTYAHELAHLLSISSEAEANYWAYQACINSKDREIRYSGYYGIFPNVYRNAQYILMKEEFEAWHNRIDKRIIAERIKQQNFWRSQYNPLLADAQDFMFNMLLKGNKISDGRMNYDRVISMILACPDMKK